MSRHQVSKMNRLNLMFLILDAALLKDPFSDYLEEQIILNDSQRKEGIFTGILSIMTYERHRIAASGFSVSVLYVYG